MRGRQSVGAINLEVQVDELRRMQDIYSVCASESIDPASPPLSANKKAIEAQFNRFWEVYPRKVAKGAARRQFTLAVKKKSALELILIARQYAESVSGVDAKYIPHPSTWLRNERWLDGKSDVSGDSSPESDWVHEADPKRKYQLYLCSREWSERRRAVHERSGGTCERCHVNPVDAVHHLSYANKYNEPLADLQGICNGCHEFVHAKSDVDPASQNAESRIRKEVVNYCFNRQEEEIDLWDEWCELASAIAHLPQTMYAAEIGWERMTDEERDKFRSIKIHN